MVALSGRIQLDMAEANITGAPSEPPLLLFVGENDLPSQLQSMQAPVEHIRRVGLIWRTSCTAICGWAR